MRVKQRTKDLAYIRRQIREAIKWYKVDDGMPNFWTTENYRGSRKVKTRKIRHYPYYTKSSRAIEDIAVKIYDKINNITKDKVTEIISKIQLIKGVKLKFKENNNIQYGQDFRQHLHVPHNVIFTIKDINEDSITIRAKGYGIIDDGDNYGNGAIHVPFEFLKGKYDTIKKIN